MPLRMLISYFVLLLPLGAQPAAAVLTCPPANASVDDPATFTWTNGTNTPNYRLLLGPAVGSSRDGDTSFISGLKGQLAGLPAGQSLYVTLWSYDPDGNPVEPPSSCVVKTAPQQATIDFKDTPETTLAGASLGSFPVTPAADSAGGLPPLAVAAKSCQAQCRQNSGCQGYTYYPAGVGNPTASCDLKSQITASSPNECCVSALKTVTQPAPPPSPAPPPASVNPASASKPPAAKPLKSVSGDWVNQFGAISRIAQKGNNITGTYSDASQPTLTGTLQGTFDGKTLRATLSWKNGADSSNGSLLLTVTPQGELDGTWTDAKGVAGPWSMKLAPR